MISHDFPNWHLSVQRVRTLMRDNGLLNFPAHQQQQQSAASSDSDDKKLLDVIKEVKAVYPDHSVAQVAAEIRKTPVFGFVDVLDGKVKKVMRQYGLTTPNIPSNSRVGGAPGGGNSGAGGESSDDVTSGDDERGGRRPCGRGLLRREETGEGWQEGLATEGAPPAEGTAAVPEGSSSLLLRPLLLLGPFQPAAELQGHFAG